MGHAVILTRETAGHQVNWGTSFLKGIKRHGWSARMETSFCPCDLLVMWGVRRRDTIQRQLLAGGRVCILERGYLGDRFKWSSVSFGGKLNGRADFRGVTPDPSRFNAHFGGLLKPWQKRDGYALLIGQVPGDMSLDIIGGDLNDWYQRTASELIANGYEVKFRAHPGAGRFPAVFVPGTKTIEGSLEAAMAGASLVVTFNSNTGVESVLSGVPTMAADGGSMAWDVTSHSVRHPAITPDREAWAAELAWKQWTLDELSSGECWARIKI